MKKQTTLGFYTKMETYKWFTKVGVAEPIESDSPDLDDHGLVGTHEFNHEEPIETYEYAHLVTQELSEVVADVMDFTVPLDDVKPLGDNVYQVDYVVPEGDWVLHVKCYVKTDEIAQRVSYKDYDTMFGVQDKSRKIILDVRFDGTITVSEGLFKRDEREALREAVENGNYVVQHSGYVIQGDTHQYVHTGEPFYADEVDF